MSDSSSRTVSPDTPGCVSINFSPRPIGWDRAAGPARRSSAARCSSTATRYRPPTPPKTAVRRDRVRVWMDRPGSSKRRPAPHRTGDLDILYEDDDLIAVNKPPGCWPCRSSGRAKPSPSSIRSSAISARTGRAGHSPFTASIGILRGSSCLPSTRPRRRR